MDFIPAYTISRQHIKIARYITTTFAYHSTSYLLNRLEGLATNTGREEAAGFKWQGKSDDSRGRGGGRQQGAVILIFY